MAKGNMMGTVKKTSHGSVAAKTHGGGYRGDSKDKDIGGERMSGIGGKKQ